MKLEKETKDKKCKDLKSLELKLEIYEAEKASRVFSSFDLEYFLNKDFEYIEL